MLSLNTIRQPKTISFLQNIAKKTSPSNKGHFPPSRITNELLKVQIQQNNVQAMISTIHDNLGKDSIPNHGYKGDMMNHNLITSLLYNDNNGTSSGIGYQMMNRNARKPNKANHGSRPCSRISRRAKRAKSGNTRRK